MATGAAPAGRRSLSACDRGGPPAALRRRRCRAGPAAAPPRSWLSALAAAAAETLVRGAVGHPARAEDQSLDLVGGEHQRRQHEAGTQHIAEARLALDVGALGLQRGDVAVERADRDAEFGGQRRARSPAPGAGAGTGYRSSRRGTAPGHRAERLEDSDDAVGNADLPRKENGGTRPPFAQFAGRERFSSRRSRAATSRPFWACAVRAVSSPGRGRADDDLVGRQRLPGAGAARPPRSARSALRRPTGAGASACGAGASAPPRPARPWACASACGLVTTSATTSGSAALRAPRPARSNSASADLRVRRARLGFSAGASATASETAGAGAISATASAATRFFRFLGRLYGCSRGIAVGLDAVHSFFAGAAIAASATAATAAPLARLLAVVARLARMGSAGLLLALFASLFDLTLDGGRGRRAADEPRHASPRSPPRRRRRRRRPPRSPPSSARAATASPSASASASSSSASTSSGSASSMAAVSTRTWVAGHLFAVIVACGPRRARWRSGPDRHGRRRRW